MRPPARRHSTAMLTTVPRDPLPLLRSLLEEDQRDGIPWTPEDFAQRVHVACREAGSSVWRWPLIDTYPAWRAAYLGAPDGLERFSLADLADG